jgi:phage terminase small subunit
MASRKQLESEACWVQRFNRYYLPATMSRTRSNYLATAYRLWLEERAGEKDQSAIKILASARSKGRIPEPSPAWREAEVVHQWREQATELHSRAVAETQSDMLAQVGDLWQIQINVALDMAYCLQHILATTKANLEANKFNLANAKELREIATALHVLYSASQDNIGSQNELIGAQRVREVLQLEQDTN